MNQSEFAASHQVSPKTVTMWKKKKWIVVDRAGVVDVVKSNKLLARYRNAADPRATRKHLQLERAPEVPDEGAIAEAARIVDSAGGGMSFEEAKRTKMVYDALHARLDYDRESGLVVAVAAVAEVVGAQLARVRTRLLAIPSGVAAEAHRAKTVAQIDALISDAIHQALEELVADAAP